MEEGTGRERTAGVRTVQKAGDDLSSDLVFAFQLLLVLVISLTRRLLLCSEVVAQLFNRALCLLQGVTSLSRGTLRFGCALLCPLALCFSVASSNLCLHCAVGGALHLLLYIAQPCSQLFAPPLSVAAQAIRLASACLSGSLALAGIVQSLLQAAAVTLCCFCSCCFACARSVQLLNQRICSSL